MLVWPIEIIPLCSYFEGLLQTGNNGINCFTGLDFFHSSKTVNSLIAVVITSCNGKPQSYSILILRASEYCYDNCQLLEDNNDCIEQL